MKALRSDPASRFVRFAPWLAGAVFLLVLALALFSFRLVTPELSLDFESRGRLLVMPVKNLTGEREQNWVRFGMMEMIAETLRRTPGVHVVAPERLIAVVAARDLDPESDETRSRIRELGLALGAATVLDVTLSRSSQRGAPEAELYTLAFEVLDGSGTVLGRGSLPGSEPARIAERLAYAVAGSMAGGAEPVTLGRVFSPSPFLNRLYGMGLAVLLDRGDVDAARPYFEIALGIDEDFLAARYRIAECERRKGRLEESRRLYVDLVKTSQDRGERLWEARALHGLAVVEAFAGNAAKAAELTIQVRSIAAAGEDPAVRLEVLRDLARFSLTEGDAARSSELYGELGTLQDELGDRLGRVDTLAQLGALALRAGELDAATGYFNEARALAAEVGDVRQEMQLLANLGEVASRRGQRADAIALWRRAATYYEQRGEADRRMLLLRNIAEMLALEDRFDEAEDAFHDVKDLAAEHGDLRLEAIASLRLTWILLRRGYPYQARLYLDRALELDRVLDQPLALQRMIAWMAYEDGKYKLAYDTLAAVKRQAGDAGEAWNQLDEDFLGVFAEALERGERLPVPGEEGGTG